MAAGKTTGKARKVTRRQLMIVLGSGALASSVGAASCAADQQNLTDPDPPCDQPAKTESGRFTLPGGPERAYVFGDACCPTGEKILVKGFPLLDDTEQGHMRPILDAIGTNRAKLMEHAVFAFGLTASQLQNFKSMLTAK